MRRNTRKPRPHKRRGVALSIEQLDRRELLSGGCEPLQLTDGSVYGVPQIDNGHVIWQDYGGVLLYDGSTTRRLGDGGGPQINNGHVVWSAGSGFGSEVFLFDGQTTQQFTNNTWGDVSPDIDGGQIAWRSVVLNGQVTIQLYDSGEVREIFRTWSNTAADPQIDAGQVVWSAYVGGIYTTALIFFYDGTATTQLSYGTWDQVRPNLDAGQVVWDSWDGNDSEIYLYDGVTTHTLTENSFEDISARISNGQVVWQGWDGNDWEIFFFDGTGIRQLTDNTVSDELPQIHDGQIVWQGSDGTDIEVFLFDGTSIRQLTENTWYDGNPTIDKGEVAWLGFPPDTVTGVNNAEIFLYRCVAKPDIALVTATTEDSRSVIYQYEVRNADIERSFEVTVFRSSDEICDATDTPITTSQLIVTSADGVPTLDLDGAPASIVGSHRMKVPDVILRIDPLQPYVCVIADTAHVIDESDETNNIASFRKLVVGAVAQGLAITGNFPQVLRDVAEQLRAGGYTDVRVSDWALTSRVPTSGVTTIAARNMAIDIVNRVEQLAQVDGYVGPNDGIDLHLIGHSRGAAVVTQAVQFLKDAQALGRSIPDQIKRGYVKITLLDPHPAHNHPIPYYDLGKWGRKKAKDAARAVCRLSVKEVCDGIRLLVTSASAHPAFQRTRRDVEALLQWFQSQTMDPEVIIPTAVHESEAYFQHAFAREFSIANPSGQGRLFNLWGEVPSTFALMNRCDLTGQVLGDYGPVGHSEVVDWYLVNVLPHLASSSRFICAQ